MLAVEKKAAVVKELGANAKDTGSSAVQVGIATKRIEELTEHLKINKKDFAARRGLLQLVGQRRRLLKYIADHDSQAYLDLIAKLGLRK